MPQSTTPYVLLGALAANGAMTGYDVRRWVGSALGHFWAESYGQIYPGLKRLAADGLAVADAAEGERKPYRITPEGRAALSAWLREPPASERVRSELALKLTFGRFLGSDDLSAAVSAANAAANARLEALTERRRRVAAETPRAEDRVFALLAVDRSLALARAEADFTEKARRVVAALEADGPDAALGRLRD